MQNPINKTFTNLTRNFNKNTFSDSNNIILDKELEANVSKKLESEDNQSVKTRIGKILDLASQMSNLAENNRLSSDQIKNLESEFSKSVEVLENYLNENSVKEFTEFCPLLQRYNPVTMTLRDYFKEFKNNTFTEYKINTDNGRKLSNLIVDYVSEIVESKDDSEVRDESLKFLTGLNEFIGKTELSMEDINVIKTWINIAKRNYEDPSEITISFSTPLPLIQKLETVFRITDLSDKIR